jgi:pilus assembly protein CpaF
MLNPPNNSQVHQEVRSRIHHQLLDKVNLAELERMAPQKVVSELRRIVERLLALDPTPLNAQERTTVIQAIQDEVLGLGPLEPLLADESISDILVNTANSVYVERRGLLEKTSVCFENDNHLMKIIDKIVSAIGRRVDESSPMVDARLKDGSRVNAIIPPLAIDGPILSIRRFSKIPLKMTDLTANQTLTAPMAFVLEGLVHARINLLLSGGTGTGKTTLLNVLSSAISADERIITIEDAAELRLQQPHVVRLETRPPNVEGKGEINQRALVRNSLRMRPNRIIVGEVRGAEVLDMLQAMNTGHDGSMATVHANSPRDALTRLENMVGMAGYAMSPRAIRQQIASALTVIVQISRLTDGKRKIVSIQELTGMEGEVISMQEIFTFEQTGLSPDGKVLGHFRATGIRPQFAERFRIRGIAIPADLFDPSIHRA